MKKNLETPIALAVRELLQLPKGYHTILFDLNRGQATDEVIIDYKTNHSLAIYENDTMFFSVTAKDGNFTIDNRISGLEGTELVRLLEGAIYCEIF